MSGAVFSETEIDLPTLELVEGMPGFPALRRFALVRLDDVGLLYSLRSLEATDVRLLVIPPAPFFPDYEVELDDEDAARLGLDRAEDALLFLVVTLVGEVKEAAANLLAPIVVNARTAAAAQIVLRDRELPLRAPLYR